MQETRQILTNNKLLIIGTDITSGSRLDEMLRKEGYDVLTVASGSEGIEAARDWKPGLILLDIVLPDIDGRRVLEAIRNLKPADRLPIIVVSEKTDEKTVVDALAWGADVFIAKPVDEAELVARINAQERICEFCRKIEEDKHTLESILDITCAISATLDSSEVLDMVVNKVATSIEDVVRCSIMLLSAKDGYVLACHDNPEAKGLRFDLKRYPEIERAVSTGQPVTAEDITNHPLMQGVKEHLKGLEGMSVVVVPIVVNVEVMGALFLRVKRGKRGFTEKELNFCRIVANSSFNAIKNARLYEEVTREKDRLKEIAITDQLTTLYNHDFFYMRLEEEFERATRYETTLSLIMMDIDDFKRVNDKYGHRTGDSVLKEVGRLIKRTVRKIDFVARYGGEEFVVILPHTPLKGAAGEAERIRRVVEEHTFEGIPAKAINLSLGVASYPDKGKMNPGELVNRADKALYAAKEAGKNCVRTIRPVD
jgi:two-component system cell cycle response regulator